MDVEIDIAHEGWRASDGLEQRIRQAALAATDVLEDSLSDRVVSIRLAADAEVQALNRGYRGKDRPTNVLSFPSGIDAAAWPGGEPLPLGDIILGLEVVCKEAKMYRKTLQAHASHLVVHAVLHLAGYDHEEAAAAQEMEALEIEILARLGIESPYV